MSGERRDYYAILGISRDADAEAVKLAFRRIARSTHPDQNPDPAAAERFKAAAEAYEVLGDPERRARYDRYGQVPAGAAYGAPAIVTPATVVEGWARSVARTVRDRVRTHRGADIRFDVRLKFDDAVRGCNRVFELPRTTGSRTVMRRLEFRIPPGVRSGQLLRWRGEGGPATGDGSAGDLIVEVHIEAHDYYRRDGYDVVAELPLGLTVLLAGGRVKVPTVWGERELEVPAGTRVGSRLRVAGCGVRTVERSGDAIFVAELDAPGVNMDDVLDAARVFDARTKAVPSASRRRFDAELRRVTPETS